MPAGKEPPVGVRLRPDVTTCQQGGHLHAGGTQIPVNTRRKAARPTVWEALRTPLDSQVGALEAPAAGVKEEATASPPIMVWFQMVVGGLPRYDWSSKWLERAR